MSTFDYQWADVVAQLLSGSLSGKPYKLGAAYIEFSNDSGTAVTPPTPLRGDGLAYYEALLSDPKRDYLRVPLTAVIVENTDVTKFAIGNKLKIFAQTAGTVGVHGKAFNDTVQSRVYGGAIVATPDWSDQTQDLVFCRWYWTGDDQLIKTANAQLSITQEITLS